MTRFGVDRLTDRELDILMTVAQAEQMLRARARRALATDAARVASYTRAEQRRQRHIAQHGDAAERRALIIAECDGIRTIQCARCHTLFTAPNRRGPAPRTCDTCKGNAS